MHWVTILDNKLQRKKINEDQVTLQSDSLLCRSKIDVIFYNDRLSRIQIFLLTVVKILFVFTEYQENDILTQIDFGNTTSLHKFRLTWKKLKSNLSP